MYLTGKEVRKRKILTGAGIFFMRRMPLPEREAGQCRERIKRKASGR